MKKLATRGRPATGQKQVRSVRVQEDRWQVWKAAAAASPYGSLNELIEAAVEKEVARLSSKRAAARPARRPAK